MVIVEKGYLTHFRAKNVLKVSGLYCSNIRSWLTDCSIICVNAGPYKAEYTRCGQLVKEQA